MLENTNKTMLDVAIKIYHQFLNQNYHLTLGFADKEQVLTLIFRKSEFGHIVGLQKLKDLMQLKTNAMVLYDKIYTNEIRLDDLKKSSFFHEIEGRIKDFIDYFPIFINHLDDIGHIKIYRCNKQTVHKYSKISADYLLTYAIDSDVFYLFLKQVDNGYFCIISFFKKDRLDIEKNNGDISLFTLLNLLKIDVKFRRKSYKTQTKQLLLNICLPDVYPT